MAMNHRGLNIPFTSFGNINSEHLFGENEQVIFDFYEANRARFGKALDIGANIGVHSILMARNGWEVKAYEPDPAHYALLRSNLEAHQARAVTPYRCAVSTSDSEVEFVRVLGNTTGSHIKGDKAPYGQIETFKVQTVDCRPLFAWADFAKIDCEGHEAHLLLTITREQMAHFSAMVEVGSPENAATIFKYFAELEIPMWSQKIEWQRVSSPSHLPHSHRDGSLFIGLEAPRF